LPGFQTRPGPRRSPHRFRRRIPDPSGTPRCKSFGDISSWPVTEFWRGQRKLVQPAFHRRRLDSLFAIMVERTNDFVARFQAAAKRGEVVDLATPLSELTLDIISRAMFSSDVQGAAAEVSRHIAILTAPEARNENDSGAEGSPGKYRDASASYFAPNQWATTVIR
jgi:cytochrome P450